MTYPNPSTALASIVVDEMVRAGIDFVVIAPGSRSTAVVLAVIGRDEIQTVVALDERSAGFHALGYAKTTGRPAAVVTTSGTAVANLMPAVVEADASGSRLVVVSADRPPELRGVGANQTIDQTGLFGGFVRHVAALGPAERHPEAPRWWRSAISQAMAASQGGRPGPVQIDLAFREPTVATPDDGRTRIDPYPHDHPGRQGGRPWTERVGTAAPEVEVVERIAQMAMPTRRGLILAGDIGGGDSRAYELGAHLGWPVLATAQSNLRTRRDVIPTGHHLVASGPTPELILRLGAPGPSRNIVDLISSDIPQVVVGGGWSDPGRAVALMTDADPALTVGALIESIDARQPGEWLDWWIGADRAVRDTLQPELETGLTEPAVAYSVGRMGADRLAVASSMPIRDVEAYAFQAPPVVSNRGASGIDGFVSTALGMASTAASPLALTGDLSLLHDANGFLCDPRPACPFVVVDNHGGGIFSLLPQAHHVGPEFERLFATPHNRDLSRLAEFHHLTFSTVDRVADLETAVHEIRSRGGLVVITTDRADNVAVHLRLEKMASAAVSEIRPPEPPSSSST